jgi:hypothetical protein
MLTYRHYSVDPSGHLNSGEWFAAENDADAIAQIGVQHPNELCEVWQGQRLVAKLSPAKVTARLERASVGLAPMQAEAI